MDLHISVFLLFGLFTAGTETDHAFTVIEYKHRALMSLSLSSLKDTLSDAINAGIIQVLVRIMR